MARKTVVRKKKKDNSKRNAAVTFGVTLLTYAALFGLSNISDLILGGLLSFAIAFVVKLATSPMKGLEAPSSSTGIMAENVEDEFAQGVIVKGLELMEQLRKKRDAIGEQVFTRRIDELSTNIRKLLNNVVADPGKASHLTKLNSYYLPTLIKLLDSYQGAKSRGASFMEISETRSDLLNTLDQLLKATRTLGKKMLQADLESMDIKIEVLEDILRADGYIESEEAQNLRTSAAQAAAELPLTEQMGTAPARKPAVKPAARSHAPIRPVAAHLEPGATLQAGLPQDNAAPAPTIPASMPTASAQQLSQGAPVLRVPGLLEDEPQTEESREDSRLML